MNILNTINEAIHLNRLQGITDENVKNAFFANYLAALLIIKLQDVKGLTLINDQSHIKLTKFSRDMNDINFWGRALFYPSSPEVTSRIHKDHIRMLSQLVDKIPETRIKSIMKVPTMVPEQIDWQEVIGSMLLLKYRLCLNSTHFNSIILALHNWHNINQQMKKRAVNQSFMYLMQSDVGSKLLNCMRRLTSTALLKFGHDQKIIGFKRLKEDEGGGDAGTSTGNIGSTSGATPTNAIVTGNIDPNATDMSGMLYFRRDAEAQIGNTKNVIKNGKVVKKKVKKFKVIRWKAPDYMKKRKSA